MRKYEWLMAALATSTLVVGLATLLVNLDGNRKAEQQLRIKQPRLGDVFEANTKSGREPARDKAR